MHLADGPAFRQLVTQNLHDASGAGDLARARNSAKDVIHRQQNAPPGRIVAHSEAIFGPALRAASRIGPEEFWYRNMARPQINAFVQFDVCRPLLVANCTLRNRHRHSNGRRGGHDQRNLENNDDLDSASAV